MNELQIFENEEFGAIRTATIDNEPWFVGKDVAEALGYADQNKAIAMHVDEEDKLNDKTASSLGQRGGWFINESGVYALVFGSKLESAKKFKRWVTKEVLPSIRKTGSYHPMSTDEKIQVLAQGNIELNEKVDNLNKDLQEFKQDMPLLALECQRITRAKNQKVVPLMGGKTAPAYKNKSLMRKVYSDIDNQLRREFGVNTYKAIKRNQCDLAVEIIKGYDLPICLKEEIETENSQMRLSV